MYSQDIFDPKIKIQLPRHKTPYLGNEAIVFNDIINAYFSCVKRKGAKASTKKFEELLMPNLETLYNEIVSGKYAISPSKGFVITEPKVREVWCSEYRDRIAHHLVYNKVGTYFESRFIHDTYSCIKGRGTLYGANRAEYFARSITNNWDPKRRNKAFYLKLDIANYFMSIDIEILISIISKHFTNDSIIGNLFKSILRNDFRENATLVDPEKFKLVPEHKSAFNIPYGKGLPIGNLTSQFASNIYLNELDQFVKRKLRVKRYGRYVDDMIFMSDNLEELKHWHNEVRVFLRDNLKLELAEDKTIYGDVYKGFDFVGYTIKPFRRYLKKATINNFNKKLKNFYNVKNPSLTKLKEMLAVINSYLGMLKHTKSYNLRKKICEEVASKTIFSPRSDYSAMYADANKGWKKVFTGYVRTLDGGKRDIDLNKMEIGNAVRNDEFFKTKKDVEEQPTPPKEEPKKKAEEDSEELLMELNEAFEEKYGEFVFYIVNHPSVPPIWGVDKI